MLASNGAKVVIADLQAEAWPSHGAKELGGAFVKLRRQPAKPMARRRSTQAQSQARQARRVW
jgi:hypothetical protein